MRVHIIRTDGSEEHAQASFAEIGALIGAKTEKGVDTTSLGDGKTMFVDGAGWEFRTESGPGEYNGIKCNLIRLIPTKALRPINERATQLYQAAHPGSTHQIVGDVAIVEE